MCPARTLTAPPTTIPTDRNRHHRPRFHTTPRAPGFQHILCRSLSRRPTKPCFLTITISQYRSALLLGGPTLPPSKATTPTTAPCAPSRQVKQGPSTSHHPRKKSSKQGPRRLLPHHQVPPRRWQSSVVLQSGLHHNALRLTRSTSETPAAPASAAPLSGHQRATPPDSHRQCNPLPGVSLAAIDPKFESPRRRLPLQAIPRPPQRWRWSESVGTAASMASPISLRVMGHQPLGGRPMLTQLYNSPYLSPSDFI
jgi:hypothetical protein